MGVVFLVVWHLNVAQCPGRSFIIYKTVATVLEVNKGPLPGSGVCTDKFYQFIHDLIELFEVDVPVTIEGRHAKVFGDFSYRLFVLDQIFGKVGCAFKTGI